MAEITGLLQAVKSWAEETTALAAQKMGELLDDQVPVATGALRDSQVIEETGDNEWQVVYEADYAEVSDTGSAPHEIVGNPLLAFEWEGELVIVHSVQHPGTPRTGWFTDTFTDENWTRCLEDAGSEVEFR
jgi:hypothetical protein